LAAAPVLLKIIHNTLQPFQKREEWIHAREADLLPVPYIHVAFALPDALNERAMIPFFGLLGRH
jgi:hypothetical protein